MRKLIAVFMVVCLVGVWSVPALAKTATPMENLQRVELMLYGKPQGGALINRLNRLEKDLFGETKTGPLLVRIENVNAYLLGGGIEAASLQLRLNAIEWMIYQEITTGEPLFERIDRLETAMYGAVQKGSIVTRVDNLLKLVWAAEKLNVDMVTVPKETLVKIKLLSELDSSKNRVGDTIRYRVVEDVMVKDRLIIPAGTEAVGEVEEVTAAGRLGRDGRILVDFKSLPAIDGTQVPLAVAEKATEKNKSLELAAGASMAGVILLGPIGLAGAYFVKGKDVVIPTGTEFYVEVKRDVRVSGLSMVPVQEQ